MRIAPSFSIMLLIANLSSRLLTTFLACSSLGTEVPPTEGATELMRDIKNQNSIQTETQLGTISIGVSGINSASTSPSDTLSPKVEFGIKKIIEIGKVSPRRIEILPFVWNQIESNSETQKVDLQKNQGVGVRVRLGDPEKEWTWYVKGDVTTTEILQESRPESSRLNPQLSIGIEKVIGGIDQDRLNRLERLKKVPQAVKIFLTAEDFDRKIPRTEEEIQTHHHAYMSLYLEELFDRIAKGEITVHQPLPIATSNQITNRIHWYQWIQRRLLEDLPLYVEAPDQRQRAIRPPDRLRVIRKEPSPLFDPSRMLDDYIEKMEFSEVLARAQINPSP